MKGPTPPDGAPPAAPLSIGSALPALPPPGTASVPAPGPPGGTSDPLRTHWEVDAKAPDGKARPIKKSESTVVRARHRWAVAIEHAKTESRRGDTAASLLPRFLIGLAAWTVLLLAGGAMFQALEAGPEMNLNRQCESS